MAVAKKPVPKNGTLASGNMEQHLRNPSCLILSHSHIKTAGLCSKSSAGTDRPSCDRHQTWRRGTPDPADMSSVLTQALAHRLGVAIEVKCENHRGNGRAYKDRFSSLVMHRFAVTVRPLSSCLGFFYWSNMLIKASTECCSVRWSRVEPVNTLFN